MVRREIRVKIPTLSQERDEGGQPHYVFASRFGFLNFGCWSGCSAIRSWDGQTAGPSTRLWIGIRQSKGLVGMTTCFGYINREAALVLFAELLDVVGTFPDGDGFFALHQLAHLFHHVGIGQGGDVPGIHAIGNGGEDAAHEFAGPRLGHVGNDVDVLGPGNLADDGFDRLVDLIDDLLARLDSWLQGDIDFGHAALDLVDHGYDCGFGNLLDGEACGLDLLGAQAVAGDVDDVIHASQNPKISVHSQHGSISREIWPILPSFAVGVLAVFAVVLVDETLAISPDSLHDARPGIANTDIASLA